MKRVALMVGVDRYEDGAFRDLRYSVADAAALAAAFGKLGFETHVATNPGNGELLREVKRRTAGLGAGDVFLFFFAGHGYTGPGGEHLLICSDDQLAFLRRNRAGVPVDLLEEVTNGKGYHRAFLLDACRTDVFSGSAARGAAGTRDLGLVAMPDAAKNPGTCCVLRSCDRFCPSLEFADLGHGVFTQAVLDLLEGSSGEAATMGESFAAGVRMRLRSILRREGSVEDQNPTFQTNGEAFALFEGGKDQGYPAGKPGEGMEGAEAGGKAGGGAGAGTGGAGKSVKTVLPPGKPGKVEGKKPARKWAIRLGVLLAIGALCMGGWLIYDEWRHEAIMRQWRREEEAEEAAVREWVETEGADIAARGAAAEKACEEWRHVFGHMQEVESHRNSMQGALQTAENLKQKGNYRWAKDEYRTAFEHVRWVETILVPRAEARAEAEMSRNEAAAAKRLADEYGHVHLGMEEYQAGEEAEKRAWAVSRWSEGVDNQKYENLKARWAEAATAYKAAAAAREAVGVKEWVYLNGPIAKTRAKNMEGMGYDRGQGFGERLDRMREAVEKGEAARDSGNFTESRRCFEAALESAEWLETNEPKRALAAAKRDAALAAKRAAEEMDGAHLGYVSYREGESEAEQAGQAWEGAEFDAAICGWLAAGEAFRRAEEAARKAKVQQKLEAARGAKARGAWSECLEFSEGVLALDAKNAKGSELKAEAERALGR